MQSATGGTQCGWVPSHKAKNVLWSYHWLLAMFCWSVAAIHTLTALNLLIHAFNSIFMVLDVIMVAHPFRLIHVCWSLLFIFTYFCFSALYRLAGGTGKNNTSYIYPSLDWTKVGSTILIVILGMLAVVVSHLCVWLIVLIRKRIAGSEDDVYQQPKISQPSSNQIQSLNAAVPW